MAQKVNTPGAAPELLLARCALAAAAAAADGLVRRALNLPAVRGMKPPSLLLLLLVPRMLSPLLLTVSAADCAWQQQQQHTHYTLELRHGRTARDGVSMFVGPPTPTSFLSFTASTYKTLRMVGSQQCTQRPSQCDAGGLNAGGHDALCAPPHTHTCTQPQTLLIEGQTQ